MNAARVLLYTQKILSYQTQKILRLKTELSNFAEEETTLRQNNS